MFNVILSYLPYALITTFTPGPNNLMTFYAVSSSGWRRGSRIIFGIISGFIVLEVLVLLFCHELAKYAPELVKYLKYVGAAYILWLAVHIARSTPGEAGEQSVSFRSGLFLALSNMKVMLYLITIFTVYVIPAGAGLGEMFLHGAFIIAVSAVSWSLWGTAGGLMQKFLKNHYRVFNAVMCLALVWCAVKILM